MRTPSLRRRATIWSVGVLALLLAVVGFGVDLALGTVLRQEQKDRLVSVAALVPELTGLSDQQIANRLSSVPGVSASIADSSTGSEVVGVPQPPDARRPGLRPAPPDAAASAAVPQPVQVGNGFRITETLRTGVQLTIATNNGPIEDALARFRIIMLIAAVVAVALAALLLPWVLGRALRPLGALTAAAHDTAGGDRGRRLSPQDPDTDLGRAAVQFDAMLEELEGAERRAARAAEDLARFLSDASHELRTPLAGISAGAERLIRERLGDEERDRVAVQVVREARRSARLVDDLLLVSRLGELRVEPRAVPLAGLLAEAADRLRSRPAAPAVEVAATSLTVSADRERTDQVLANLLVNAANAGARTIRVAAAEDDGSAVVRVEDDGPGIPEAQRDAVFERLVRLDAARGKATGGAGLGLPIARGLAEAQGGTLRAVAPGDLGGAAFELRIPLVVAASGAVAPRPAAVAAS